MPNKGRGPYIDYSAAGASRNVRDKDGNALVAYTTRLDFSSANPAAADTDGGLMKGGTSSAPITQDTADMKFLSFYFDNGATSGDTRGLYLRQYFTGTGIGGEAARIYSTVSNVTAGTVRGAHISLDWAATGKVTGLGCALETTLHIPTTAGMSGTVSSIKAAINSDGASSDPAGATSLSVFNVVNQGNATGMADVDTDCCLFDFQGWATTTGSMIVETGEATGADWSIRIRLPNGALGYIQVCDGVGS